MRKARLDQMINGWFIGDFEPAVVRTAAFEAAVKYYKFGDAETRHHHKVATEITVIAQGRVRMNGDEYQTGDVVLVEPNESTDFEALEDSITIVIKTPSVIGDKYLGQVT